MGQDRRGKLARSNISATNNKASDLSLALLSFKILNRCLPVVATITAREIAESLQLSSAAWMT